MTKGLNRRQLVQRAVGASAGVLAARGVTEAAVVAAPRAARQFEGTRITVVGREVTIPTLLELSQD